MLFGTECKHLRLKSLASFSFYFLSVKRNKIGVAVSIGIKSRRAWAWMFIGRYVSHLTEIQDLFIQVSLSMILVKNRFIVTAHNIST